MVIFISKKNEVDPGGRFSRLVGRGASSGLNRATKGRFDVKNSQNGYSYYYKR
jgi:hypothetical protein